MPTRIDLPVGRDVWPLLVRPEALVRPVPPAAAPPAPPRELVRVALAAPLGLGAPLRAAVTPDDQVAVVFDPALPQLGTLVAGVLDHLAEAGIPPTAVTLIAPPGTPDGWAKGIPVGVRTETHDPADLKRLAYLATTRAGRRVYLNRAAVEADVLVVLSGRGYDPVLGYAGAEAAVFPALSDDETRAALTVKPSLKAPEPPGKTEATEVLWLLGMPLLVQVVAGPGDGIELVVAGLTDSSAEGVRRQDDLWRYAVAERPDLVVCAVAGDPARADFLTLAKAAACGARVVNPGGRVAVLSQAAPPLGAAGDRLRGADEPADAAKEVRGEPGGAAAYLWAAAARRARLFVAAGWPDDLTEELFATPLGSAAEVQRLIDAAERVLVVPDADKTMIDVRT